MDGAAEWSYALGQIDRRLGSCDRSTSSDNGVTWTGEMLSSLDLTTKVSGFALILRYILFISLTYTAVVQPM